MGVMPSPRRRTRHALSSLPMRYLSSIITDRNVQALTHAPVNDLSDDEAHAFNVVQGFYRAHQQFPTVETMLEAGVRIPDAPEPIAFYRTEVFNSIRVRRAAELVADMQPLLEDREGTELQDLIRRHRELNPDPEVTTQTLTQTLPEALDRFTPDNSVGLMIPTGIEAVDAEVGGVRAGGVWAIAGRPAMGKTFMQVAGCLGMIRMGQRVLYISKEMSNEEMIDRILLLATDLNPSLGTRRMVGTLTNTRLRERVTQELGGYSDNLIMAEPDAVRNMDDVGSLIRDVQPDHTLIDGTYFIEPSDHNARDSRNERYEKLVRGLQQTGRDTRCPIGVTWQQNRQKQMGTEGLYGSDALSQDASLVLMLKQYRSDPTIRGLWVAKNRHGPQDFEIGAGFSFQPTDIGSPRDLPEARTQRNVDSGRTNHIAAAVRQATGGSAPGADSID